MVVNLREIEESINRSTQAIDGVAKSLRRSYEGNDMMADTLDTLQLETSKLQEQSSNMFAELEKLQQELRDQRANANAKEQEYIKKVAHLDEVLKGGIADAKSVKAVQDAVDGMNMGEVHEKMKQLSIAPSAADVKKELLQSPNALARSADIPDVRTIIREELKHDEWIQNFMKQFLASQSVRKLVDELVALNKKVSADLFKDIPGLQVFLHLEDVMKNVGGAVAEQTSQQLETALENRLDGTAQTFATAQAFWTALYQYVSSTGLDNQVKTIRKIVVAFEEGGSLHKALGAFSERITEVETFTTPEQIRGHVVTTDAILKLSKFLQDVPDTKAIADLLVEVSKLAESRGNIRAVINAIEENTDMEQIDRIEAVLRMLRFLEEVAQKLVHAAPLKKLLNGIDNVRETVDAVNADMKRLSSGGSDDLDRNPQSDSTTGRPAKRSFDDMNDTLDKVEKDIAAYAKELKRARLGHNGGLTNPALLRPIPDNMVVKTVASFAPARDTTAVIFGAQVAVIDLAGKIDLGYIGHKIVSESQPYDRSIMALSTALDDIMREHKLPALGLWPATVRTSQEYQALAQALPDHDDPAQAEVKGVLTWQAIKVILELLPKKIAEDPDREDRPSPVQKLQLGVCIRSSYHGGYVVLGAEDASKTTIWMINEDPRFTAPNHWDFGELWTAIASPKAVVEQLDDPVAFLYEGIKRQLHDGVMKYARTDSPALLEQRPGSSGRGAPTSRSRSRATYSLDDAQTRDATTKVLEFSGLISASAMHDQAPSSTIAGQAAVPLQAGETPSETSSAQAKPRDNVGQKLKRRLQRSSNSLHAKFRGSSSAEKVNRLSNIGELQGETSLARAQGQTPSRLPIGQPKPTPSSSSHAAPAPPPVGDGINPPPQKGKPLTSPPATLVAQWGKGKYYDLSGQGDTYASSDIERDPGLMQVLSNPKWVAYALKFNQNAGKPSYCCQSALALIRDGQHREDRGWDNGNGPCNECLRFGRKCWIIIPRSSLIPGLLLVYKGSAHDSQRLSPELRGRSPVNDRPASSIAARMMMQDDNIDPPQDDPDSEDEATPDEEQSTARHILTNAPEGTPILQPPAGKKPVVPDHYGKGVMIYVGPPGANKDVINEKHFDATSLEFLKKSWAAKGQGNRRDYSKMRVQCAKVNATGPIHKDFLSAAKPLPAEDVRKNWDNPDSNCNQCELLRDRECFLFINEEVVWYKHNNTYA